MWRIYKKRNTKIVFRFINKKIWIIEISSLLSLMLNVLIIIDLTKILLDNNNENKDRKNQKLK